MKPVDITSNSADPEARPVVFVGDHPEVQPLPALVYADGRVVTEWELSEEELLRLLRGERIRLWIWTDGRRLQPVFLMVTAEDGLMENEHGENANQQ